MTSTRLRLPFTLAADDSNTPSNETSSPPPPPLDEQEQEALISTLRTRDAASTAFYAKILTILPLLFTPLYLPLLLSFSAPLLGVVAISSLCLTAWTTHLSSSSFLQPSTSNSDSNSNSNATKSRRHLSAKARGKLPARYEVQSSQGQMDQIREIAQDYGEQYAGVANMVLCVLLLVWALLASRAATAATSSTTSTAGAGAGAGAGGRIENMEKEGEWIQIVAPVAVAAVGWLGTWWVSEQVDVAELERLRYRLKGV